MINGAPLRSRSASESWTPAAVLNWARLKGPRERASAALNGCPWQAQTAAARGHMSGQQVLGSPAEPLLALPCRAISRSVPESSSRLATLNTDATHR